MSMTTEHKTEHKVGDGKQTVTLTVTPGDPGFDDAGERIMRVNMGPQHPSTHGVFRAIVDLDGETIIGLRPVIGYLHRGIEKLAESRTWAQVLPYTDRLDYVSAMNNNQVYCMAVEKLAGIEAPERAELIRLLMAELNRIQNHLLYVGAMALDLGAYTPFLFCFRERETIYDLFEAVCGARITLSYLRIGGVSQDLPDGWLDRLKKFMAEMPGNIDEYEALLTGNEIFQVRMKGVGPLTPELALSYGISGPNLRATGINYDVRRQDPYSLYDQFDFEVPLGRASDCFDRYTMRILEMRQSIRIIEQAIKRIEETEPGTIIAKVSKILKPPAGEAYAHIEGPNGDLGCYVVSDGTTKPYRFRWRSPMFMNIALLPEVVKGWRIADFIAIFASLYAMLGEVDR